MYYASKPDQELELAQADNSGMGFLPLIPLIFGGLSLASTLLSKPEKPKGPTPAQIMAMQQMQAVQQQRKYLIYGGVALAGLLVIGGAVLLTRRKS